MPPYIGKKALKLQRQDAERACLRHRVWTRLFFERGVDEVARWLRSPESQPLTSLFSPDVDAPGPLDEVILPATRAEVDAEYYRVTYCRAIAETGGSASWPETLYERLVACLFEHGVSSDSDSFSSSSPSGDPSAQFVSMRALKVYLSLLALRERNVARLCAELQQYTVFDRADVVELERVVAVRAWKDTGGTVERVDDFLHCYDMHFANVAGYVWGGGGGAEEDEAMRTLFVNLLFERKQHAYLVENHFQVLNAAKWTPVAERVNRPIERVVLQANSDYYTCRKCKRKETNVQSLQLRSSDEPATIIVTCVHCHTRFTAKN